MRSTEDTPLLISKRPTHHQLVWEGKHTNLSELGEQLGAEIREVESIESEIIAALRGHDEVFFTNEEGSIAQKIVASLLDRPSYDMHRLPRRYSLAEILLEPLRRKKDRSEIAAMRRAISITTQSMQAVGPLLVPGTTEQEVAYALEAEFLRRGAVTAFRSIVASGPNAGTLHHERLTRVFKRNDIVLIDCGAEVDGYAADLTRSFPIGDRFREPWAKIYDIVCAMQDASYAMIRPGQSIAKVHQAAVEVLVDGLRSLKLLRGSTKSIIAEKKHVPFMPHGISHSLGLDVHDVGSLRNGTGRLEAGMVLTVEPGLYVRRTTQGIPASGIRIEDDVVVTENGCDILSRALPRNLDEVIEWIG